MRCSIKKWCKEKGNDCKVCNKAERTQRHMDAGLRSWVKDYKEIRPRTDNGQVDGKRIGGTVEAAIKLRDKIMGIIKKYDLFKCRVFGTYDYLNCKHLYYYQIGSDQRADDGNFYPDENKPREYKCCKSSCICFNSFIR